MHLFFVGDYDETLVVAERVVSIQGELEVERGSGAVRMYSNPNVQGGKGFPHFTGSLIGLDNGVTIPVPQSPAVVGARLAAAIVRQSVMPDG